MASASKKDDYDIVKALGSGAFGSVSKVRRRSDRVEFAMKIVQIGKMEEREVADALNECRILASVRNPRIVNFECAFLSRGGKELCLVMELCEKGDLAGRIKKCQRMRRRVDERGIWAHLVEMAEGLVYLHSKNICHRDLKPANIFLAADGTAKLGDLNVSKLNKGDDLMSTKIGTPYYMAPEVWNGKKYGAACDIWSLGCVMYELAALQPPFQGNSLMQLRRAVNTGRYNPLPMNYSPQLSRMLGQLIVSDPRRRLTALELVNCDEVVRRRNQGLMRSPEAPQEDEGDAELMATIKPPRAGSRQEMKALSEKLADMSAQVATARSESKSNLHENGAAGPKFVPSLGSMAENGSAGAAADAVVGIPPAVGGGSGNNGSAERAPGRRAYSPPQDRQPSSVYSNQPPVPGGRRGSEGGGVAAAKAVVRGGAGGGYGGIRGGGGGGGRAGGRDYPQQQVRQEAPAPAPAPVARAVDDDLPEGWKKVPSQSRPGQFSYLNVNTGERVAEKPSRPASQGGPLPPGWRRVPSQSRPGEWVYMNTVTGERIAWRPTQAAVGAGANQAGAPRVGGGQGGQGGYRQPGGQGGYR